MGLWKKLLLGVLALKCLAVHAGPSGIYEPKVKWSKPEVSVCWGQPLIDGETFTPSEKLAVRLIVMQEFTAERTGIHFTGFEDCLRTPDALVWISTGNSDPNPKRVYQSGVVGRSEIGEGGLVIDEKSDEGYITKKKRGPYRMYLYANRERYIPGTNYLYGLKTTALHEFGHLAGLRHEHFRIEAQKDYNCSDRKEYDPNFSVAEPIYKSTEVATDYDPNSIMNYCWIDQLNANGPKIFLVRDLKAFHDSGHGPIEEPGIKLPTGFMPTLIDTTLYTKKSDYIPGIDMYDVKLGLSAGDLKAVQCMYKQDKIADLSTCKLEKPKNWISI